MCVSVTAPIFVELPIIKITNVNTRMCSASVRWSLASNNNDACLLVRYDVQLIYNGKVLRRSSTDTALQVEMDNLAPDTNYTIAAMDSVRVYKGVFFTAIPVGM